MDVSLRLMVEGFKMFDTVIERTAEERMKRAEIAAQDDSGDEEYTKEHSDESETCDEGQGAKHKVSVRQREEA